VRELEAAPVVYRRMAGAEIAARLPELDRSERRSAHYRVAAGGSTLVRVEADEVPLAAGGGVTLLKPHCIKPHRRSSIVVNKGGSGE
jgi:hypothetical protein